MRDCLVGEGLEGSEGDRDSKKQVKRGGGGDFCPGNTVGQRSNVRLGPETRRCLMWVTSGIDGVCFSFDNQITLKVL